MYKNYTLEDIWNDFNRDLLKFIISKVDLVEDSEDILQEVFIKIHKNISHLKDNTKIKSWIFTITRNKIYDFYKKKGIKSSKLDEGILNIRDEKQGSYFDDTSLCIFHMIKKLPIKYRNILEDVDIRKVSQTRLSQISNISLSGIKSRVQRGRKMLGKNFSKCCEVQFNKYGTIVDIVCKKRCDYCS